MGDNICEEKKRLLDCNARKVYYAVNDSEIDKGRQETHEEYKQRWRSIRILYMTMFFSSVEFAVVMSSLWPYLQKVDPGISETFLGWTNSGFSLCQLLGSVIFGIWCNYRPAKEPLLFSQAALILGSFIYGYAESFKTFAPYAVLIGRLILGFSTGNGAVCRTVLSQSTTLNERVKAFANNAIAQAVGFFFGPAIQVAVAPIGSKSYYLKSFKMNINVYTLPGFLGVIVGLVCFLVILCFFSEQKVDIYERNEVKKPLSEDISEQPTICQSNLSKPDFKAIAVTSVMFFVLLSVFALNETILTPLVMDEFAWTSEKAVLYGGIILSVSGVIAVLAFQIVKYMAKKYGQRRVLAFGLLLTLAGFIVYLPWGKEYPVLRMTNIRSHTNNLTAPVSNVGCPVKYHWCQSTPKIYFSQFLVAATLVAIGYPIGFLVANTIYSQLLGPRKQGIYMAWISAVGSFARVIGPLLVSNAYEAIGPRWTFLIVDFILALCILLLGMNYQRIIPFHEYIDKIHCPA